LAAGGSGGVCARDAGGNARHAHAISTVTALDIPISILRALIAFLPAARRARTDGSPARGWNLSALRRAVVETTRSAALDAEPEALDVASPVGAAAAGAALTVAAAAERVVPTVEPAERGAVPAAEPVEARAVPIAGLAEAAVVPGVQIQALVAVPALAPGGVHPDAAAVLHAARVAAPAAEGRDRGRARAHVWRHRWSQGSDRGPRGRDTPHPCDGRASAPNARRAIDRDSAGD